MHDLGKIRIAGSQVAIAQLLPEKKKNAVVEFFYKTFDGCFYPLKELLMKPSSITQQISFRQTLSKRIIF